MLFLNAVPRYYTSKTTYSSIKSKGLNQKLDRFLAKEDFFKNYYTTPKNVLQSNDRCETIHIGIVCSGFGASLYLHTLLKSIYFYRVNPLHFHVIANKISEKVLRTLFETWNVPQVNVTFYNLYLYTGEVRWIPNSHYSGIHGLMKLVFPRIIPIEVTSKLLVLDTDITVVNDIYELWSLFKAFNKKQAIGIVENQSDYYLGRNNNFNPWPAIGRGFNSGVLLYDLLTLKRRNWPKLWSEVTKRVTLTYGPTRLADQDIINTVLKENPEMLFEVPCYWNTQLSDRTLSQSCYRQHIVKLVHWNSPKKYNVLNKDGDYFRNIASGFMEYNGNLLRKQLLFCDNAQTVASNNSEEFCSEFHRLLSTSWRTLLYFREYQYSVSENDVTFVAQLSYDRLQTIEQLVKCWPGPMSLTLYVSDPELEKSISFISNSDILQQRSNVAYHAVFKDGDFYPINTLRNVGLRQVQTPYVFLADIDFLPNKNLYEMLIKYLFSLGSLEKKALVIPAFEIQSYGNLIPRNKKQVLKGLKNKSVIPFLSNVWSLGHAPTNYEKWKAAEEPYTVKWEPDYEPYVVVRRDVVEYDERFVGFGWNKVSHIMELEAQNYEFVVLPDVFIVHKPHAPSYDIARFRSSPSYRLCLQMLKEEFIQKLNRMYNRIFEYSNSSMNFANVSNKRRKRNFLPPVQTTVETNTDYPSNME